MEANAMQSKKEQRTLILANKADISGKTLMAATDAVTPSSRRGALARRGVFLSLRGGWLSVSGVYSMSNQGVLLKTTLTTRES